MNPVATRITIGAGLIAGTAGILLADVALDPWVQAPGFWLLLTAAMLAGSYEFTRMLRRKGYPCRPALAMAFTAMLVAAAWSDGRVAACEPRTGFMQPYLWVLVALVLVTFLAEILSVERPGGDMGRAAQSIGWTVLVVMTVGLLGVFLAKIRFLSPDPKEGLMYLALVLGVVKGSDIGAYAIGSALGRHKLVPTLSPKKTVEGLFGGLAAGIGMALAIGCGWGRFAWWQMVLFGLAVSIAGLLGDLAESLIKRACGVKDSGPIPGFGGALDILDSMLAAAPVAYLALVVLTGPVQ
jgi:phosphatidate cytidylyltransferase